MAKELASQLADLISGLQRKRQEHVDAIAEIDAIFEQYGIKPQEQKRRGRPPGRKPGRKPGRRPGRPPAAAAQKSGGRKTRRRTRRKFAVSGLDSIMGLVKSAGKKGVTTSEIVGHWKSEGRSGNGYNALGQLVKEKKLTKEKLKNAKGSRYKAA